MKAKARPAHEQYARDVTKISLVVAAVVVVGLATFLTRKPPTTPPPQTNTVGQLPAVVTPENFQNFIGPITQVKQGSLAVRMTIVRPGGTQLQRDYEVKIDPATALSLYLDKSTGPEIQPATLADFHSGDRVGVFSQENLYSVTSFTALKIYKIVD